MLEGDRVRRPELDDRIIKSKGPKVWKTRWPINYLPNIPFIIEVNVGSSSSLFFILKQEYFYNEIWEHD